MRVSLAHGYYTTHFRNYSSANVMVEYSYEEALEFLGSKEKSAKKQLKEMTEDLAFVRNQIITCEVNISRVYNWDVRKRRIAGQ